MSAKTLDKMCNIKTGKLDANQAVPGGNFPFFTCAEHPDRIDSFAFDDDVVLVAGNNASGNFHVNRYRGKFNAYQRTYVLTSKQGACIDYVYYALKLELKRLRERAQGSQTKFLTMPILTGIGINDIDFDEQQEISQILASIDKKIELNKKINAALEAMAKLIYDYWFVQFDFPDSNGKPYKSSGGKMVYNEELKREIPEGWEVKQLSEISVIKAGGDKPKIVSEEISGNCTVPIYSNGIKDYGLYGYTDSAKITSPSITISARGTIGVSFLRMKPFVPIIRLIVVTPNNQSYLKYLDEYLSTVNFENSGSVQKQLTAPQVSQMKIIIPPDCLLDKYTSTVTASVSKIEIIKDEIYELSMLRDWLLPMLMNGQVTVN